MSVEDASHVLRVVQRSFDDVPRNDYEGNNRYLSNSERLKEADQLLAQFSGARINELCELAASLRQRNEKGKPSVGATSMAGPPVAATAGVGDAFALDLVATGDGEDEDDELAKLTDSMAKDAKKKKDKKNAKAEKSKSGKKGKKKGKHADDSDDDPDDVELPLPLPQPVRQRGTGESEANGKESPAPAVVVEARTPVASEDAVPSFWIPSSVLGTKALCTPIPDTALATVDFPDVCVSVDGMPCTLRVELYRCVLLAVANGPPISIEKSAALVASAAATAGSPEGHVSDPVTEDVNGSEENDDPAEAGDDESQLQQLSHNLIAQYEVTQGEVEENARAAFPTALSPRASLSLRDATNLPWVVLTCVGGYFSGGVFAGGKCIKHKSFQRYVVRKKQGGRQATNGGGSCGSIGSQIRMAQEVKWKLEVRDLLVEWRQLIDDAAFILYAAPGPMNRNMLTDFSALPPPSTGRRAESPISIRDPRVCKVPITTHRPTLLEVHRIYDTVSKVNLKYFSPDDDLQ